MKTSSQRFIIIIFILVLISCKDQRVVKTGLDQIQKYNYLFKNKRIGIITNQSAFNSNNKHIIDLFLEQSDIKITALFGPEHGIRGESAAGEKISNQVSTSYDIPVYSLYDSTLKPTVEMLKDTDVLVFDIQDVGARFYTYIHTMSLAMEAAAENNITFVVLDRPNPINGIDVEGNILEPEFTTFVGLHPIPVRHGLTIGEIALMLNGEGWLKNSVKVNLHIVPMMGWKRHFWFDQTGLKWYPPSPNMLNLDIATVYPGTCLFEGTNISEGRGTYRPFLIIGAPWYKENQFELINKTIDMSYIRLGPVGFTPISIPNMAPDPKYKDIHLTGISLFVTDRNKFRPYLTGISLVKFFYQLDKKNFEWKIDHFDRLCGSSKIREFIVENKNIDEIKLWIDKDLPDFMKIRAKYLLYGN